VIDGRRWGWKSTCPKQKQKQPSQIIRKCITNELNIPSLRGLLFWAPGIAIDAVHDLVQSHSASTSDQGLAEDIHMSALSYFRFGLRTLDVMFLASAPHVVRFRFRKPEAPYLSLVSHGYSFSYCIYYSSSCSPLHLISVWRKNLRYTLEVCIVSFIDTGSHKRCCTPSCCSIQLHNKLQIHPEFRTRDQNSRVNACYNAPILGLRTKHTTSFPKTESGTREWLFGSTFRTHLASPKLRRWAKSMGKG
jgi:hypothetical protein